MLILTAVIIFQVSLELGGNAPCIVFDDADIDVAVKGSQQGFSKKNMEFWSSSWSSGEQISKLRASDAEIRMSHYTCLTGQYNQNTLSSCRHSCTQQGEQKPEAEIGSYLD